MPKSFDGPLCSSNRLVVPKSLAETKSINVAALNGSSSEKETPVASCIVVGSEGRCVVAGFSDGYLHMWGRNRANTASQFFHIGSRLASPDSEDTAPEVYDLALSGSLLISGGADGVVRSFRARVDADEEEEDDEEDPIEPDHDFYPLRPFEGTTEVVRGEQTCVSCVALPPDSSGSAAPSALPEKWAVSGGHDGALCVWDADGGERLQRVLLGSLTTTKSKRAKRSAPWVVGVSIGIEKQGNRPIVLSANVDGELVLWVPNKEGASEEEALVRLVQLRGAGGLTAPLQTAKLSPDATWIAAGFANGALSVWNAQAPSKFSPEASETELKSVRLGGAGDGPGVSSLCWRAEGSSRLSLLVGSEGGACERWSLGGALSGGNKLAQPAMQLDEAGEIYMMGSCAPTGEVFLASGSGEVHGLGVAPE